MKYSYRKSLIIKVCSLILFFLFHYGVLLYQKQMEETMMFNDWAVMMVAVFINIFYGALIGCFFYCDARIVTEKNTVKVMTIAILTILSIYRLLYFAPILGDFLPTFFVSTTKYFQWALGVYLTLLIPRKQ